MDNRILAHRGWRVTDGLVGSFEMLRAEQGLRDACSSGNRESLKEVVRHLTVEKLDQMLSNGRDYPTGTPLFEAILCEQAGIVEELIHLGCDLEQECCLDIFFPVHYVDTGPALGVACATGNLKCVSLLLKAGASVNHAGKSSTALMSACQDGNTELINVLLEAGADVNLTPRCDSGSTALHVSSFAHDNVDNIRLLVAYGGDINAKDADGHTPVFKACLGANSEVAELLLQHECLCSPPEDRIKMFWLLGSQCLFRLDSPSTAIRYWKWSGVIDTDFKVYNETLRSKLTEVQRNAGIHHNILTLSDIETLLNDRQKLELQALVFLYLVFGWGKETVSCLTTQITAAIAKQRAWLTCQLFMFSEDMVDQVESYNIAPMCDNISQTVEDMLELCLGQSSLPPQHLNVILNGILCQILKLLEKIVNSSELGHKKILKLSHLQCSYVKTKRERAEQMVEGFLGVLKYGLTMVKQPEIRKTYISKLEHFCKLCQLPSSVSAKLNCTVWKTAVYGGPCCAHSLVWQHHNLFPCPTVTRLLIECGLDLNCRDESLNSPLHNSLLCQEPCPEVVRLLVEGGAGIDLPNKEGIRPYNIFMKNSRYDVNVVQFSSLKSLATETIVKHRIPYSQNLPSTLVEFVKARDVIRPVHGYWKTNTR